MGIRIHKMMGYGLTDVKFKKYALIDERFDPHGIMRIDYEERENLFTLEGFMDFLSSFEVQLGKLSANDPINQYIHKYDIRLLIEQIKERQLKVSKSSYLGNCFNWGAEYGMGNVFCVTSFIAGENDYRYDDPLDYYEETWVKGQQKDWVKTFDDGFYPYIGSYLDKVTGRRLDTQLALLYRRIVKSEDKYAENEDEIKEEVAKKLGFDSVEDCEKRMTPALPAEIRLLCEYCKVFKDKSTILEMKPMIYTYWG